MSRRVAALGSSSPMSSVSRADRVRADGRLLIRAGRRAWRVVVLLLLCMVFMA